MKEIIFKDDILKLLALYIDAETDTHTIEVLKSLLLDVSCIRW